MGSCGFPKSVRLLRSRDFRSVYDRGARYTCPLFAAFSFSEDGALGAGGGPRIGFTTPKALGKAVIRNRIKRRLREAVRMELESLSPEWSIVFNPRRKALESPLPDLQAEVKRLFLRLGTRSEPSPSLSLPASSPDISV